MQNVAAVLFDLDGTLVDSAPDLTTAVNRMLADRQRSPMSEARMREWIGNGARKLVARALAGQRHIASEPAETEDALAQFFVHYTDCLVDKSVLYPGVRVGLERLKALGLPLGVVTNKPGRFTDPLLKAMDLAEFFPVVVSGDTLTVRKPDPAPLLHAASALNVPIERCVYVGDSLADRGAADAAGALLVRVPYGYPGEESAFAGHPQRLTMRVDELAEQINGIFAA